MVDSTGFYNKTGQALGYGAIEHITFTENMTITVIDTVKQWDLNEDASDMVEGSMQMTAGKAACSILENGKIESQ